MKKKNQNKISKKMLISEIVETYPDAIPILMSCGLHCIGCHLSEFETLEQGCKVHGIPEEEIKKMIKDCNKLLKEIEKNKK